MTTQNTATLASTTDTGPVFTIRTNDHPRLDAISVIDPRGYRVAAIERTELEGRRDLTHKSICAAFTEAAGVVGKKLDGPGYISPRETCLLRQEAARSLNVKVTL